MTSEGKVLSYKNIFQRVQDEEYIKKKQAILSKSKICILNKFEIKGKRLLIYFHVEDIQTRKICFR